MRRGKHARGSYASGRRAAAWSSLAVALLIRAALAADVQGSATASPAASAAGPSSRPPTPEISWTWTTVVERPGDAQGWAQFERDCAVCHGSGPAKPGTRALRAKYRGKLPALLEERTDLTRAYVKYIVRHGVTVMPPFRKTELSDPDLEAIASYLTRKRGS